MDPAQGQEDKMAFLIPIEKDQKPFKCGLCSFAFDIILQLDAHISDHSRTKPFQCGFCLVSYDNSSELTQHVDTHQLFMCVAKGPSSDNPSPVKTLNTDTGGFRAKDCAENTREPVTSGSVSVRGRMSGTKTRGGNAKEQPKRTNAIGRGHFSCDICKVSYHSQTDFKKHSILVHRDDRPFHCAQCPSRFKQNIHLTDHVSSVHGSQKRFECQFCGERFKIRNYLRNHIAKKHPDVRSKSGLVRKRRTDSDSQLSREKVEMGSADREETEVCGEDQTAGDSVDDSGSPEEDSDGDDGNPEEDEALPHSFLTTSLSATDQSAGFAVPRASTSLWSVTPDQKKMKVEMDYGAHSTAGQGATSV